MDINEKDGSIVTASRLTALGEAPSVDDRMLQNSTVGRFNGGAGQRDKRAPRPRQVTQNGVYTPDVFATPLARWDTAQKRVLDVVLSGLIIVMTLPCLLLIALAIRLDSKGPSLFRQPRIGLNNSMFDVIKFRTMYHHLSDINADRQATRGDKRVTRVGRFLRKTSLDELPQLLNVLRGEMSLVGPRPHAPNTRAGEKLFHQAVAGYALRHRVKPGITGWAQVNGWRGETKSLEQLEQRVAHDMYYIENWSLGFDLKIIALTALCQFNSKNAY